jgi:leucyl aminopeptidase (aminopeptidase T)
MTDPWASVAKRAVDALGVRSGEVVQLRDHSGRQDVLVEMLLAIEARGATPRLELLGPEIPPRLLADTDLVHLQRWDRHRSAWMDQVERVLVLAGADPNLSNVPPGALEAWVAATNRLLAIEERCRLPFLLVAVATRERAEQSDQAIEEVERVLLPALAATPDELQREVDRILPALAEDEPIVIRSRGLELRLRRGGRRWFSDVGRVPSVEQLGGAQPVLNLPAGSVYTTVIEDETIGSLYLAEAGVARDVAFHLEEGRVVGIEAASGAEGLAAMFDRHSGEPRRISHVGIGLNPYLTTTIGWPLVDEYRRGRLLSRSVRIAISAARTRRRSTSTSCLRAPASRLGVGQSSRMERSSYRDRQCPGRQRAEPFQASDGGQVSATAQSRIGSQTSSARSITRTVSLSGRDRTSPVATHTTSLSRL